MNKNKLSWWGKARKAFEGLCFLVGFFVILLGSTVLLLGGLDELIAGYWPFFGDPSLEQRLERLEEMSELKRLCDLRNGYWQEEHKEGATTTIMYDGSGFCRINGEYYYGTGYHFRTESNKEIKLK